MVPVLEAAADALYGILQRRGKSEMTMIMQKDCRAAGSRPLHNHQRLSLRDLLADLPRGSMVPAGRKLFAARVVMASPPDPSTQSEYRPIPSRHSNRLSGATSVQTWLAVSWTTWLPLSRGVLILASYDGDMCFENKLSFLKHSQSQAPSGVHPVLGIR